MRAEKGVKPMLAVQGYYDGTAIRMLEKLDAKPYQRVIITVMDEFVEPRPGIGERGMRGALARYANPALAEKEKDAWARAAVEKHGDT